MGDDIDRARPDPVTVGPLVASRYRLHQELASGGMGSVHRADDEVTGRAIAIKRLLPDLRKDKRARRLFEREYRVLAQLRHPRIIQVHHYGIDVDGPFYTMELLEGRDLRDLAPLAWREACRHLRDVAASLALLHVRGLLHRDVSPRNVRLSAQGRAKLIDFGALAEFGSHPEVVGTPPCIPPETMRGEALDQRSDLYALGALAYWVLTGRHAYSARNLDTLAAAWSQSPRSPREIEPDIPPSLESLVMSLLSHDPLGRPSSAAEVIDRLNAIAGLVPDTGPEGWQSYLQAPVLVGRDRELRRIRSHIGRAMGQAEGSAVLVEGAQGVGRTRLLDEAVIEAELQGATVLRANAATSAGSYGVVRALADELMRALPEPALEAARPHVSVLVHLLPHLRASLAGARVQPMPDDPAEQRTRMQDALTEWLRELTLHHPLVLCVDDTQSADDGSLALLAVLPRRSEDRHLTVLCALRLGEPPVAPEAAEAMRASAHRMRLRNLQLRDVEALLRGMFGDVNHLGRLIPWVHGQSGGNPLHLVELARLLVQREVIRYAEGTWVIPSEVEGVAATASFQEALGARLRDVPEDARALARALGIGRGPFGVSDGMTALGTDDEKRVHELFHELVAQEVMLESADGYAFRQESLRVYLERELPDEERKAVHLRFGRRLEAESEDPAELLEAGWHLLRGGEESRGADLLVFAAGRIWRRVEGFAPAAAAFEAALEVYDKENRPPHALAAMLTATAVAGWYVDRRLMERHGDRAVALAAEITGIARARRLRPKVGGKLALTFGVGTAAFVHLFKKHQITTDRRSFQEMFVNLFGCAGTRMGVAAVCLDSGPAARTFEQLSPLPDFGEGHIATIMYHWFEHMLWTTRGKEDRALQIGREVLQQLDDPKWMKDLDDNGYRGLLSGLLLSLGVLETQRDVGAGLAYADRLEELGLKFYRGAAAQLRTLHHAYRGEVDAMRRYQAETETLALQGGSTWQTDIFVATIMNKVHQSAGDVIGLKHASQTIARWAEEIPSLQNYADSSRASYALERGRIDEAIAILEEVLPRQHGKIPGWADAYGPYARALMSKGRVQEAHRVLTEVTSEITPEQRSFVINYLEPERQLALAEARLGNLEKAQRQLNALLEERAECGPVTLGHLHEARAEVALLARDRLGYEHHARQTETLFRGTGNPALVAQLDRMATQAASVFQGRVAVSSSRPPEHEMTTSADRRRPVLSADRVRSILDARRATDERADKALSLLVEATGADGGYFFGAEADGFALLSQTLPEEPPTALRATLRKLADQLIDQAEGSTLTVSQFVPAEEGARETTPSGFEQIVLHTHYDGQPVVVGGVALAGEHKKLRRASFDLIDAVARSFFEAGDVATFRGRD